MTGNGNRKHTTAGIIGESRFTVDTALSDWTGVASVQFLSWAMQEAAWKHAESIGFTIEQMEKDDILWLLTRQQIRISKLPQWKDDVIVRTWYADREKLLFHRDFEILNGSEDHLASVTSAWVAVDTARRRPVRTESINHGGPVDRQRAVTEAWTPIPETDDWEEGTPFPVLARDLDMSGHVNNVHYPEWLLEPLTLSFREGHDLIGLDVAYRAEAVHGDVLIPRFSSEDDSTQLHQLVRQSDGKLISSGRSYWRPRQTPRAIGWSVGQD